MFVPRTASNAVALGLIAAVAACGTAQAAGPGGEPDGESCGDTASCPTTIAINGKPIASAPTGGTGSDTEDPGAVASDLAPTNDLLQSMPTAFDLTGQASDPTGPAVAVAVEGSGVPTISTPPVTSTVTENDRVTLTSRYKVLIPGTRSYQVGGVCNVYTTYVGQKGLITVRGSVSCLGAVEKIVFGASAGNAPFYITSSGDAKHSTYGLSVFHKFYPSGAVGKREVNSCTSVLPKFGVTSSSCGVPGKV